MAKKVLRYFSKIKFEKYSIFPAVLTSSIVVLFCLPLFDHNLSNFNRIVSASTAINYDVSKFVNNIFLLFTIFVISFCASYVLFNHLRTKSSKSKEQLSFWHFLNSFSIIASISIFLVIVSSIYLKETSSEIIFTDLVTPTSLTLFAYFIALILYIILKLDKKIRFDSYQRLIIVLLVVSFAVCIAIPKLLNFINIIQYITIIIITLIIKFIKIRTGIIESITSGFVIVFSIFPMLLSVYIETLNILNQHNIFVSNPILIYRILFIIFIIIASLVSSIIYRKKLPLNNWKKFVYPVLIVGICMLSVQLPLIRNYDADIFESANYSILISDFFNFGKVPIVEHYGGHMLTNFLGGIIYGVFNNDFANAIYSPYSIYFSIITYILLYFLISKVTSRDIAFLSIIFLPFITDNFEYFGLGILVVFSLLNYFKKPNYLRALLVDLSMTICILYRLDLGFAFGISAIIASIIYAIFKKKSLKKIIISSIFFVAAILVLWFVVSTLKGIDPIAQLKQFIALSASNQNWAIPMFHRTSSLTFIWAYIILPLTMLSSLSYLIFAKIKNKLSSQVWLILILLGIAYFANFSRGIIRHNITELPSYDYSRVIFWTSYLYLAIFISAIKQKPTYFIPSYIGLTLLSFAITGASLPTTSRAPLDNIKDHVTLTVVDYRVNRVRINQSTEMELLQINNFISPFLEPDGTFFDFTNRSLIYSYMGKLDPIYAAQTPGHLNGDFSQGFALNDIETKNIKVVLMPNQNSTYLQSNLDGIPNSLRYYKLSEYIYQKFTPLINFENGEIWVSKDSYTEKLEIAKEFCKEKTNACQVLANNTKPSETYRIGYIPLLWGEKDTKNASSNQQLATVSPLANSDYYIFENDFDKSSGNYLKIVINSDTASEGELSIGSYSNSKMMNTATYIFNIEPGQHTYLFRISHDEDWYNNVNALQISSPNTNISILKGD